jgi:two-component system, NtrC family, sensor kinase
MFDDYQIPAIALIAALLLAFSYLHARFQSVRTLLWIQALACAEIQSVLLWLVSHRTGTPHGFTPEVAIWVTVAAQSALMLSSALFLASLSPLSFRVGNVRILYAVPYAIPLVIYSILYYGPFSGSAGQHLSGSILWPYCFLACWGAAVALIWSLQRGAIPIWLTSLIVAIAGLICIPFFVHGNVYWPLLVVECSNMLMAALLVLFTFRRFSPGVVLATCGFIAWALPPFFLMEPADRMGFVGVVLARIAILGKVFVATGLILLVLEDEIEKNRTAQRRERRVRLELEAYARQALTARSLEEFDRDSTKLCEMIVEHSCFTGAAMVVRGGSEAYTIAGYAGMDGATAGALDALVQRLPSAIFSAGGEPLVRGSTSLNLDLTPWLIPGDDLERLQLTRVGAVPMLGPDNSDDGALLLTGPRAPLETLRADDLLPLEILAGRLQAARAQAMMLGKLIESERFAGVGQLATNVAHQLNNPLTVILGYSALLEESTPQGPDRRGAEAIAIEARRMKAILERLGRFSRLTTERFSSFSAADLISDIEQLHRTDFLRHSIEFRASIAPALPSIFGNPHQVRQALLHAVQYAIDSVIRIEPNQEKAVRVEASGEDGRVHIVVTHSGSGFAQPDRAFDSFSAGFTGNEATGVGLSLCAAIVREHRGHISAVNNEPSGAAILIDLPVS